LRKYTLVSFRFLIDVHLLLLTSGPVFPAAHSRQLVPGLVHLI